MPQTDETALEKTFSDLAYAHLRDKSQSLLDYLVGFQMLKQEEDGQRAVGIFGFEIDGDYYYAPVFFLNGEIRGLDSLYSVKSDLFIPLTEGWVSTIVDKRQLSLGDSDKRSRNQRGVHVPNYSRLKVIPGGGGGVSLKLASAMMGERQTDGVMSLTEAVSGTSAARLLKSAALRNPHLLNNLESYGYSLLDLHEPPPTQRKHAAAEKPVVVINSITDEGVDSLTDEQRKTVIEGGTVVLDNRPEVAKAMLFRSETKQQLENPTGGGLYDVLWSSGDVSPALVCPTNDGDNNVFVFEPDEKKYAVLPSRQVFVIRKYGQQEMNDWLKEHAGQPSDVRTGQVVVFISRTGEATNPLCLSDTRVGLDGITVAQVNDRHNATPPVGYYSGNGNYGNAEPNTFKELRYDGNPNRGRAPSGRVAEVVITETGGVSPRFTKSQCVVNDRNFYALKVNTFKLVDCEYSSELQMEEYDKPRYDIQLQPSCFGDYSTIYAQLDKVATDLKAWRNGTEITVKEASCGCTRSFRGEAAGLRTLMGEFGLGEQDAKAVIKEASQSPITYKYVGISKTAAELLDIPDIMESNQGGYMTSFQPEEVPFSTMTRAQSPQNREFYQYYSPFGGGATDSEGSGSDDTLGVVDEAARTGQKEVFDAAALGSLIKSHNPTDLVDRFLPTITAGMDRVGRMLFLIFWHYEDFEERYGENDLSDFVDSLRSVFEQLGDVIVFAKKRSLAGDPEHFGMGALPVMGE